MAFDIRHESRGYLQALGDASTEIGKRNRTRDQEIRDREFSLRQQDQRNQMERFYQSLAQEREAQSLSNQTALDLQKLRNQGNVDEINQRYDYDPRLFNRSRIPTQQVEYSPSQLQEADSIRNSIQKVMQAPNLRPVERQRLLRDLSNRLKGIAPIPSIRQPNGPSDVQKEGMNRVQLSKDGSAYMILQPDGKLEITDNPAMVKHTDMAKYIEIAGEMLKTVGSEGEEIPASKKDILDLVWNYFIPMAMGRYNTITDEPPPSSENNPYINNPYISNPLMSQLLAIQKGKDAALGKTPQIPIRVQDNSTSTMNPGGVIPPIRVKENSTSSVSPGGVIPSKVTVKSLLKEIKDKTAFADSRILKMYSMLTPKEKFELSQELRKQGKI